MRLTKTSAALHFAKGGDLIASLYIKEGCICNLDIVRFDYIDIFYDAHAARRSVFGR